MLNRRRILAEICEKASLAVHSEGTRVVEGGLHAAWINLQVPIAGSIGGTVFQMVLGEPCNTPDEARERAAQRAIERIMTTGNIVIDDVNYSSLYAALGQLRVATAQSYYNGVQATHLAWQRDDLSRKKDGILTHLAHVCTSFDVVLPIKVIYPMGSTCRLSGGTLMYTGPMPPVTRVEHVAWFIIHDLLGPEYTNVAPVRGQSGAI